MANKSGRQKIQVASTPSLLKKAGSTVVEYFEWDLPEALS